MASKEYAKLSIESFTANDEITDQSLCPKCSTDVDEVMEIFRARARPRLFGRASVLQTCVSVLLLIANLGTIGLWWKVNSQVMAPGADCVRPLLSYCEIEPSTADENIY